MAVSPCHHGNLLSLLLATHIVCAECSAVTPRYLYSLHHECFWVFVCCVFNQHVWRAPYLRALALTHPQTHTVRSELLLTESFEVWRWELDRIRQAAAVWYSCRSLPTAGVSQHSLKFNQSPLALKPQSTPTLDPWLPPFAPVTHALCGHRKIEAPNPTLPIWTPAFLFSSWSTALLSSFNHPTL